ncbi:hypothetical protein FRC00_006634 [Tulasnella sp. 408]|nr:hypothetical protein FRC00_006634 [Tulasnella sp. 408]
MRLTASSTDSAQNVASSRGHKAVTAAVLRETGRKVKSNPEGGTTCRNPPLRKARSNWLQEQYQWTCNHSHRRSASREANEVSSGRLVDAVGDEKDDLRARGGDEQNAREGGEEDWQRDETGELDQDLPDEDEPEEHVVEDGDAAIDKDMMSPTKSNG